MIVYVLGVLCFAYLLFSGWVTYKIIHDQWSTSGQRVAQILLVWLLPIIGAMIVRHIQRQNPEHTDGTYGEVANPGEDFGMSGRSVRNMENAHRNHDSSHND